MPTDHLTPVERAWLALADAATADPWTADKAGVVLAGNRQVALACGQAAITDERGSTAEVQRWNGEHIASARTAVPALARSLQEARERVAELEREVEDARVKARRHAEELAHAYAQAERRNRELDALHYVWCDGGCEGGVHRFGEHPPLTEAIVREAKRNTARLSRWWINQEFRRRLRKAGEALRAAREEQP